MVDRVGRSFPQLSLIPVPSFSPRGARSMMKAVRHCFRSLNAGVARLRPRYARYPLPSGWTSTPWLLRQAPTLALVEERAFRLSPADFRRARISVSVVRLSTSRFSGQCEPQDVFGHIPCRMLRSACYPCCLSATELPDRLPSSIRNPIRLGVLGSRCRSRSCFKGYVHLPTDCALTSTRTALGQVAVLTGLQLPDLLESAGYLCVYA